VTKKKKKQQILFKKI